jgi:hypothetical protein
MAGEPVAEIQEPPKELPLFDSERERAYYQNIQT